MPLCYVTFYNSFKTFFLTTKSWKKHPQKLLRKPQIHFFSLTAQTAQAEEFMFQNVAYWPTVYRTADTTMNYVFKWNNKVPLILIKRWPRKDKQVQNNDTKRWPIKDNQVQSSGMKRLNIKDNQVKNSDTWYCDI